MKDRLQADLVRGMDLLGGAMKDDRSEYLRAWTPDSVRTEIFQESKRPLNPRQDTLLCPECGATLLWQHDEVEWRTIFFCPQHGRQEPQAAGGESRVSGKPSPKA